jgi:hypothetical protein
MEELFLGERYEGQVTVWLPWQHLLRLTYISGTSLLLEARAPPGAAPVYIYDFGAVKNIE